MEFWRSLVSCRVSAFEKKRISAAKTCRDCSVSPVASASADSLCLIGCSWCPCCFWSYLLCCLLATLPGVCPASFCVSYFTISFNININFIILSASVAGLSSWFCSSFQIISVLIFFPYVFLFVASSAASEHPGNGFSVLSTSHSLQEQKKCNMVTYNSELLGFRCGEIFSPPSHSRDIEEEAVQIYFEQL